MAFIYKDGGKIANIGAPVVIFDTKSEFDTWHNNILKQSISINDFIIIKNYQPIANHSSILEIVINDESFGIYEERPKYFTLTSDTEMIVNTGTSTTNGTLFYSITNGEVWVELTTESTSTASGKEILFKGTNLLPQSGTWQQTGGTNIIGTGNIATLISENGILEYFPEFCFKQMFLNWTELKKVDDFPPIPVYKSAFEEMFSGCTSLISTPYLASLEVGTSGYKHMFEGCTSLITVFGLPAIAIADFCYFGMFKDCTSLMGFIYIPPIKIKASSLAYMFMGCTSLITAPDLSGSTIFGRKACEGMYKNCVGLKNPPQIPFASPIKFDYCYLSMFEGCTSLITTPDIPLDFSEALYSCQNMFNETSITLFSETEDDTYIKKITNTDDYEWILFSPLGSLLPGTSIYSK